MSLPMINCGLNNQLRPFSKYYDRHSLINTNQDHYVILGFNEKSHFGSISDAEIKENFYKLAKKYHPDSSFTSSSEAKLATQMLNEAKFKTIIEAYEILSDKEKKKNYDMALGYFRMKKSESKNPGKTTST